MTEPASNKSIGALQLHESRRADGTGIVWARDEQGAHYVDYGTVVDMLDAVPGLIQRVIPSGNLVSHLPAPSACWLLETNAAVWWHERPKNINKQPYQALWSEAAIKRWVEGKREQLKNIPAGADLLQLLCDDDPVERATRAMEAERQNRLLRLRDEEAAMLRSPEPARQPWPGLFKAVWRYLHWLFCGENDV